MLNNKSLWTAIILSSAVVTQAFGAGKTQVRLPKTEAALQKRIEAHPALKELLEPGRIEGKLGLPEVRTFVDKYSENDVEKFFQQEVEFRLRRSEGTSTSTKGIELFSKIIEENKTQFGFEYLNGTVDKYFGAVEKNPGLGKFIPKAIVLGELAENQKWWTGRRVAEFLDWAEGLQAGLAKEDLASQLETYFKQKLPEWGVEAKDVEGRIKAYSKASASLKVVAFDRLFGTMTREEIEHAWYGENPLEPSPDSLVGKYIAETGAATKVQSFLKYYQNVDPVDANKPGKFQERGPERLVVAVSAASYAAFEKAFLKRIDWVSLYHHATVLFEGRRSGYDNSLVGKFEQNQMGIGHVFPAILLDSNVGQRVGQFMAYRDRFIMDKRWYSGNPLENPQMLKGAYGMTPEQVRDCDGGCTHFFLQMQAGTKRTTTIRHPKQGYGQMQGPLYFDYSPNAQVDKDNDYARIVHPVPARQSLADMISPSVAAHMWTRRGLSTGAAQLGITGKSPTKAVPVVFVFTADHTAPIVADVKQYSEAPN